MDDDRVGRRRSSSAQLTISTKLERIVRVVKMSACAKTCEFFAQGTSAQFEAVLKQYDEALRLKAENKSQKPENVIKLDKW